MAPDPKTAFDGPRRERSRKRENSADLDPVPGRRRRVNTNSDILYVGAEFQDTATPSPSYPPHLQISEDDQDQPSNFPQQRRGSASDVVEGADVGSVLGIRPVTAMEQWLIDTPYLQPDDFDEYFRRRSRRGSRSHRTGSSASRTHDSQYLSAKSEQASSLTDDLQPEQVARNDRSRATTPYFTPSVTPSRRSQETPEDDDGDDGREPDSPAPRSNFFPYNARRTIDALASFEERFHGAEDRGPTESSDSRDAEEK